MWPRALLSERERWKDTGCVFFRNRVSMDCGVTPCARSMCSANWKDRTLWWRQAYTPKLKHFVLELIVKSKSPQRDFPGGPVLPTQGAWDRFLVWELRSHKPHGSAEKGKVQLPAVPRFRVGERGAQFNSQQVTHVGKTERSSLLGWKPLPSSSPWGESAPFMNPHTRHVSPFLHSCVQQYLQPCHQGDALRVHWQMCSTFSRTEAEASPGPGHRAHASTASQETFALKACLWLQDWEERWVRKNAVVPFFATREI